MILTKEAQARIKAKDVRILLAAELFVIDQTIQDYIRKNEDNGPLTTYGAVRVMREATGLSDAQILQERRLKARAGVKTR